MAKYRNQRAFVIDHPKKRKPKHRIRNFLIFLILLGLLSTAGLIAYLYSRVPDLNPSLFDYSENAIIYDRYGNPYQNLQGEENRQSLSNEEIPEVVKDAFISIEDKRFYSHHGIDFYGTGRAIIEVITNRNLAGSGGSTITQQLIKQTHLSAAKTIERKFDEWILAYRLENIYSKEQILTSYLNKINFHGAEGIQAAAQQYFGKDAGELNITEAAVLAAVPNAPSYFDPYTYNENGEIIRDEYGEIILNENNKERAIEVISKMFDQGYITLEEADTAKQELQNNTVALVFNNPNRVYSYFTDEVYTQVLNDLVEYFDTTEDEVAKYINTSGLKIYSTVDPFVQSTLEEAVQNDSLFPSVSDQALILKEDTGIIFEPETGATVIDNSDGSIVGLVGGRENNASLTLNRASVPHQVGSSTKPITTYAPALEEEVLTLDSVYVDEPINIDGWQPQNSDGQFRGPVSVKNAIINSINTIAVKSFEDLGLDNSLDYGRKLGLTLPMEDENAGALALGGYTIGQTTIQMAAAYSTFARNGDYVPPYIYTKIEDSYGNVILYNDVTSQNVFSPDTSYLITEALKEASTNGTAHLNIKNSEFAGKTGTTDNFVDAYYSGYTPNYSMSVWYGYDAKNYQTDKQNYPLNIGVSGGSDRGPASLFEAVINKLESNTLYSSFHFDISEKLDKQLHPEKYIQSHNPQNHYQESADSLPVEDGFTQSEEAPDQNFEELYEESSEF